jgi:anion-transporting  ArsA/GET3 family ATPase
MKQLVINNVIAEPDSDFLASRAREQAVHIRSIYRRFGHLKIVEVPLFPHEIRGLERIEEVERALFRQ